MAYEFAPPDIEVAGADSRYSDVWSLTVAQLGAVLKELAHVSPNAQLTEEDLTGYHFVQYGIGSDVTAETLELARSTSRDSTGEVSILRRGLSQVLGDSTHDVVASRIRLGTERHVKQFSLPETLDHFATTHHTDHRRIPVVSLYPQDGVRLWYRGRASLGMGWIARAGVSQTVTINTDVVEAAAEDGTFSRLALITSDSRDVDGIRSIHLL